MLKYFEMDYTNEIGILVHITIIWKFITIGSKMYSKLPFSIDRYVHDSGVQYVYRRDETIFILFNTICVYILAEYFVLWL